MTPAEFLALSDERDQQERRRLAERQADYRAGYRAALADMQQQADRAWAAAPPRHPVGLGPTFAELDRRRYGKQEAA